MTERTDPRYRMCEIDLSDRQVILLCRQAIEYRYSDQLDKAYDSILLACQYAQDIQSRSAYILLVGQLLELRLFQLLPELVNLGQQLGAEPILAKIAPILVKLGKPEQAIALVHNLNLDEHNANNIRSITLAKVAVEIVNQGNSQKADQLITESLQIAQHTYGKNKILAAIAIETARAGFYEKAIEIAQEIVPVIRKKTTLDTIETLTDQLSF